MGTLRFFSVLLAAFAFCASASAQTLIDPLFGDNAVLQRDKPIRVWGQATPRARVEVQFAGARASARADASGRWQAVLPARPAGGPHSLMARAGAATQSAENVMLGDVFLCSGQSNMAMGVREIAAGGAEVNGSANPNIRLLQIARAANAAPQTSHATAPAWRIAGPDSVGDFSAACFFMGREIQRAQNVAVGLINSSVSASLIEAWISPDGFRRFGGYEEALAQLELYTRDRNAAQARFEASAARWWEENEPGTRARWHAPDLDDGAWRTTTQLGPWENFGDPDLSRFDGAVWFRATVMLTAAQAAQSARLTLGRVDDYDNTFVNGVRIGGLRDKASARAYAIPDGALRAGRNVIAIGVIDTGTGGGLIGPPEEKTLRFADGTSLRIDGPWRYRIAGPLDRVGRGPLAPWAGGLSAHFNAMIAPLAGLSIRGVAWYQGESNIDAATTYERLLPALMADWRTTFRDPALPFLIVQLPNYGEARATAVPSALAELREAQRRAVNADAHAALVTTIDIGDRYDIHPTNKQEAGRRLGLAARRLIYREDVIAAGPRPVSVQLSGDNIEFTFDQDVVTPESDHALGMQLCDDARRCVFAAGHSEGRVVRVHARPNVTIARYCWADSPFCNVANSAGLPATPFELPIAR